MNETNFEGKCDVFLVKNGDEEKMVSFDTVIAAKQWIENYNTNSQRAKTFVIKPAV
jgi:hypothetical protein